jgi:Protein of unknown function (DUF3987)
MPREKLDQMPWEDQPFEDHRAATQSAVAAAQSPPPAGLNAAQHKYAEEAFRREIDNLEAQREGTRNDTLNTAAFALGQLVGAGALEEREVREALFSACRVNGHLQQDGEHMVFGTIDSGVSDGKAEPRDLTKVGTRNGAIWFDNKAVTKVSLDRIQQLEGGFWLSRDSLQTIYLGALARMCAPWAVLGYCAARVLALVRPHTVLPALIGGNGSLNWFTAIAAPSGGGKGSAAAVARYLVDAYVRERGLGSGEGLIDAYVKPSDKETGEPAGMFEAVMFTADEIDTLHALSVRSGNTMSSILRSGFSGETLGFSYRSNDRHIEAHTYRMTLVVNVQPARAGALMDDARGGTLQRFMWFPGTDERISIETPEMPLALALPPYTDWAFPKTLKIPGRATRLIRQERVKAMRGEQDHLDGHALFIREKFAFALAVLDGRSEMCEADWDLAGVASRVSDHTRDWVSFQLDAAAKEDAEHKGMLQGVAYMAADEEKGRVAQDRNNRIAKRVLEKIVASGDKGLTKSELNNVAGGRDRPYLPTVLERLVEVQRIQRVNDTKVERWITTNGHKSS